MIDLNRQREVRKHKKDKGFFPKGILDVIEVYYPERYPLLSKGSVRTKKLFSEEEWIDILTKSRNSHEKQLKRIKNHKNI